MSSTAAVSGKKATHFRRSPSETALERAEAAARRVSSRAAPIRQAFIRSQDGSPPPLARMLRGGRGGAVRLKLYLSMIWIASSPPYDTAFPSRGWAELLDLNDPERNGARCINDAINWLAEHEFIRIDRRKGYPSTVYLNDDRGNGSPYRPPGSVRQPYIKLPASFWTGGWIATLSGSAVAVYLILFEQNYFRSRTEPFWISPRRARELYALSADTWTEAVRDLRDHKLILVRRVPVKDDVFGWARVRNAYTLDLARLNARPF